MYTSLWKVLRLALILVAVLVLAGCGADRSDFPSWLYAHPPQVSTETGANLSDMPAVYSDGGNKVVVAWSSDPTAGPGYSDVEIYWRRYNALGVPQTAPVRVTYNSFADYYPSIAMNGGITYLVWMGDEISSSNIYWAALDLNGGLVAGPTMISDATYNDYDPHIVQCGDYSNVVWSGDSASYDFEIYYAKVRYNGIIDIPYRRVSSTLKPDDSPHIQANWLCSELYVGFQYDYSYTDSDVYVLGIDTSTGAAAHGPVPVAASSANEDQVQIWVDSPLVGTTRVGLTYRFDDGAGGEIDYASRNADLSVCALATSLTDDSQTDAMPALRVMEWSSAKYGIVVWERVEAGTGTDRDIYLQLFDDDCSPTAGTPALISNGAPSGSASDVYPSLLARAAPDGTPVYAALWRVATDGSVWARFGSLVGLYGDAELISDSASGGYPSAERPGVAAYLGNQIHATWIGDNSGTDETWYQQTAWRALAPETVRNRTGDELPVNPYPAK